MSKAKPGDVMPKKANPRWLVLKHGDSVPEHFGQHDECADCNDIANKRAPHFQPERGEVAEALGLSSACCQSCGIHFDKHDYAFFRIGRLRSEVELAIRLLKQGVTAERVIRELEQVLMDTMSDYRPPERKPR